MDSTAQKIIAVGIVLFLFLAGFALIIYVSNKFDNNG